MKKEPLLVRSEMGRCRLATREEIAAHKAQQSLCVSGCNAQREDTVGG